MSNLITKERNLIKNLDPFSILCHIYRKYARSQPTTEMLVELLSASEVMLKLGTITIPPYDPVLEQIRILSSDNDPKTPKELILTFPKELIRLIEAEQEFGPYTLSFEEETMVTSFNFENINSKFIDKISLRFHARFTENEDGNFHYIEPVNYERFHIKKEVLTFKSCSLSFHELRW